MIGEATRRCPTHATVLTKDGACLLCERRRPPRSSSLVLALGVLVGAAVVLAIAYRLNLGMADYVEERSQRRAAAAAAASSAAAAQAEADEARRQAAAAAAASANAKRGYRPVGASRPTTNPGVGASPAQSDHDQRIADAAKSVRIDLYGAAWCPACREARSFMDSEGIAYSYHDVDDSSNRRAMRSLNPSGSIPTINIEGQVVVGHNPSGIKRAIRSAAESKVATR
jgi:glutaredoxin